MKVVLISQSAFPGILLFRKDLIKQLVRDGCEVNCLAMDFTDDTREKVIALGAVPVDYSLSRTGLNPFRDLMDTIALSVILKRLSPDLVFAFFAKPVIYGALASRIARVPRCIGMLEGLGFAFTDQPFSLSRKARLIRSIQIMLYKVSIP